MIVKRRAYSTIIALTLLLSTVFPVTAFADTIRTGGTDRFDTAVQVAQKAWPSGTSDVVLVNAYAPSDAAVAGPLAFKLKAPILLTDADKLSESTLSEIKTLGAKKITVIGGTGVISVTVENRLKDLGYQVLRYSGADRFETAASIASSFDKFTQAVIVNGEGSMDALASASWSAANKSPILYTEGSVLNQATKDALAKAGVTNAIVIGGEGAVSKDVFNQLPNAKRYGGNDRYETAANLAAGLQPNAETVYVATGTEFSDAMVAVGLAAQTNSPIIYVDKTIPAPVENYLKANQGKVKNLSLVGGAGSISNLQQEVMLRLAGLETSAANKAIFDAVTAYFNNPSGWISPDDLQKALTSEPNKNLVLDVRQADAYAAGHIKGAINVPFNNSFGANLTKIRAAAQGKTVTVACYTGQTAAQVTSLLNVAGIKAQSLLFGMGKDGFDQGWLKSTNPVVTDSTPMPELPAVASPSPAIDLAISDYFTKMVASYQIKAPDLKTALDTNPSDYLVVDIRKMEDFNAGHIKGAVNVPWGPKLAENLASLQQKSLGKTVVVVCYTGQSAGKTTSLLNLVGINTKALAFGWGRPAYPQEGWNNKGYTTIDTLYDAVQSYYANMPSDSYKISLPILKAAIDANSSEYVVLDVRQKDAYDKGHIKGAINVPYGSDIAANLDNIRALAQGKTLIVACYTGQTAGQTDSLLNLAGIKTRSLDFGMGTDAIKKGWLYQDGGYPVVTEATSMPNTLVAVPSPNPYIDAAVKSYFDPMPKDSYKIGLPEAKTALETEPEKYLVVDIRSAADYAVSHIKGAINVPFAQVGRNLDLIKELSQGKTVIVNCYTGQTAGQTDSLLNVAGIPTKSLNFGFGNPKSGFIEGWGTKGYDALTEFGQ